MEINTERRISSWKKRGNWNWSLLRIMEERRMFRKFIISKVLELGWLCITLNRWASPFINWLSESSRKEKLIRFFVREWFAVNYRFRSIFVQNGDWKETSSRTFRHYSSSLPPLLHLELLSLTRCSFFEWKISISQPRTLFWKVTTDNGKIFSKRSMIHNTPLNLKNWESGTNID